MNPIYWNSLTSKNVFSRRSAFLNPLHSVAKRIPDKNPDVPIALDTPFQGSFIPQEWLLTLLGKLIGWIPCEQGGMTDFWKFIRTRNRKSSQFINCGIHNNTGKRSRSFTKRTKKIGVANKRKFDRSRLISFRSFRHPFIYKISACAQFNCEELVVNWTPN